jgi:hypothetical protein
MSDQDSAAQPTDLMGFLKGELSDEAMKVAHQLLGDLPGMLQSMAGAAAADLPALTSAVLAHPFMQHLEAQLPAAALGVVHGMLGLAL